MAHFEDELRRQDEIVRCARGLWDYLLEWGPAETREIVAQMGMRGYGPDLTQRAINYLTNKDLITGPGSGPRKVKEVARRRYRKTGPPLRDDY